jgi:hypothetical protein
MMAKKDFGSSGDAAKNAVRKSQRSVAKEQGGSQFDSTGMGDKKIGGEYAAGDCDDHRPWDERPMPLLYPHE